MRRCLVLMVVTGAVAVLGLSSGSAGAGHPAHAARPVAHAAPPYLTIQPARPGYTRPMPATRYAYGWFGAEPRQHCVRHFGYARNFTQWTAR